MFDLLPPDTLLPPTRSRSWNESSRSNSAGAVLAFGTNVRPLQALSTSVRSLRPNGERRERQWLTAWM